MRVTLNYKVPYKQFLQINDYLRLLKVGKVDFFADAPIDTENTIVYDAFSGYDAYKHQGIVNKKSERVQLAQQKNPLPGKVRE